MINSWRLVFAFGVAVLAWGCTPKVIAPVKQQDKPREEIKTEKPIARFTAAQISLLIPFKLNQYNLASVGKSQLDNADMAIDFYQGVLLGIDSAAAQGLDFNINVYDTRDENSQLAGLLKKESLKRSHLIIGPVFPEGVKFMSNFSIGNDVPLVSPLAASKPSEFNNPKLISVVNNIDQHAEKISDYIGSHYQPKTTIVVLINPKKSADEQFAIPIRNRFKLKHPSFIVQEFTSTYAFERNMIRGKKYAVIVCSSEMAYVASSIDKLYKLHHLKNGGYDINLFGHPNWSRQNYKIEQLKDLSTIVSSSYRIDYKSNAVISFIKKYRAKYHFEPSEYSFKGFDIGYYFARLLARHGAGFLDYLTKERYNGLHNSFSFAFDPRYGYFNTELMLMQYANLSLKEID